jgi:hypothetical protein
MNQHSSALLITLTLVAACGSEPQAPGTPAPIEEPGSNAGSGGSLNGAGGSSGSANVGGAGSSPSAGGSAGSTPAGGSGGSEGSLLPPSGTEWVAIPSDGCTELAAPGTRVVDSGATTPAFDHLGSTGSRRFAHSRRDSALVTFQPDGSGLSAFLYGVAAAAGGEHLDVVFDDGAALFLQRYSDLGPAGSSVPLGAGGRSAVAASAGEQAVLVTWAGEDGIGGAVVDPATGDQSALDFESATLPGRCKARSVPVSDGFALLAHCVDGEDETLSFARVSSAGLVSDASRQLSSLGSFELVDFIKTSAGFAFVLGHAELGVAVGLLDDAGAAKETSYLFSGTSEAFGLAESTDHLGLVARVGGRAAFSALDAQGAPLQGFHCLDPSLTASIGDGIGGVARGPDGFVTISRHPNGSSWLQAFTTNGDPIEPLAGPQDGLF